ncbi:acetate/propionate family kinase [Bradyrhizobium sp.]|uniref:acetate/propionate family kinase n=1 Tax=Bradyrhizobium sp. TaxID=376 RepID=UPI001EC715CA|nr:acetate/propionate family kinase [Bradyrhizobium sp.]MBV9978709.1 acetate/propionate family kinase [Bradyrhizobium sp.]
MPDAILAVNAGSSSIKLAVFAVTTADPTLLCSGLLDAQDAAHRLVIHDASGGTLFEAQQPADDGRKGLYSEILRWIESYLSGGKLLAVGHRIVHGGPDFSEPVEVTLEVLDALDALTPLAPLHQGVCLAPIRSIAALRPDLPQIACFDTAFHHHLTPPVSRFAIPRRFEQQGIRRYGFHGLSFEYIAGRLGEIAQDLPGKRTVVAHLGNGASLCAMRSGRSVDTTMGLTPLDGLVMGTRCGAIDPGVLLYLLQEQKLSADELQDLLYRQSGLLGVSGLSADMRVLLRSDSAAAREAIELFTLRASREIVAMANTLEGLECLVFTGGIGEHSAEIRQAICARLHWLGVRLDETANAASAQTLHAGESKIDVLVIPTSEETSIARHCKARLSTRVKST